MSTFAYQQKHSTNYFEGWYVRLTDQEHNINLAMIFAMTTNRQHPHSFIQLYNHVDQQSTYFTFPIEDFQYNPTTETISIGNNTLSPHSLFFETPDITISATFQNRVLLEPYKNTTSAMGPMVKSPLECFQEVVFLDAEASITIDAKEYIGKSYMEKTYGTKFPSRWMWIQANHSTNNTLLSFSVGKVPILFFTIVGFFLLYRYKDQEFRFATYNRSKIKIVRTTDKETTFLIRKKRTVIIIKAQTNNPVELVGPRKNGYMDLPVFESLDGTASIQVYESGKLLFEDQFTLVGIELMYRKK